MQDWSFICPVTAYRYQEDLKTYKDMEMLSKPK